MNGSVYRKKNARLWTVQIDVGRDENGRRVRKTYSGFRTKRAAESARVEYLSKLAANELVAPSKITLGQWLTKWLETAPDLAATTRQAYGFEVNRLIRGLGPRTLQQLTPQEIEAFYRELGTSLSAKTIRNCHSVLRSSLADAVRQNVLVRNPTDAVRTPRLKRPEVKVWTEDELRTFLNYTKGHRLHGVILLMIHSGMRRSELLGLPWSGVDWTNERLSITDTVVVVDHRATLRINETKTKGSRRVIALDSTTMDALRTHRSRQAQEKLAAGEAYDDQDLVVAGTRGEIFSPDLFTRTVKRLAGEAGVTPLGPHAARHSFATISLSRGVGVKTVAERLGHASVQTTWDRYGHIVEGQDRALADLFAEAIE